MEKIPINESVIGYYNDNIILINSEINVIMLIKMRVYW